MSASGSSIDLTASDRIRPPGVMKGHCLELPGVRETSVWAIIFVEASGSPT